MPEILKAIKVEGISWDERSVPRLTCVPSVGMNDRSIVDQYIYLVKGAVFFTFLN